MIEMYDVLEIMFYIVITILIVFAIANLIMGDWMGFLTLGMIEILLYVGMKCCMHKWS